MGYVKWMDGLSRIVKIILCIFYLDTFWMVYRVIKAFQVKNIKMGIAWILIAVFLGWIWWVIDLFTVIVNGKIIEF